ncbi:hypothetical protein IW261DRAFT_1574523 [Armillaria novae-zelandiae]|uniref:Uncharacterized protein n=1 Tax=Armillaria novae-zelandiae TaxID=153914 RepID=A0AA39NIZ5_9AGAR|nr:hypothetical protein IW261DRAFT_1574523 [Armillaria novae-zelandiae]
MDFAEHSHSTALGDQLQLGLSVQPAHYPQKEPHLLHAGEARCSEGVEYGVMYVVYITLVTHERLKEKEKEMDNQEYDRTSAYKEDESTMPRQLCHHDDDEERVFWPISGVVCPPKDDYGHRVCCFVGDEEAVTKHLVVTEGINITHHKLGWVYFQGKPTDIVCKEWAVIEGIRTFQDNIIVECVHSMDEDELEATDVTFELGDWVTPYLGAYHGDVGCVIAIHDWGYNVTFILWYFSHSLDHPTQSPLLITMHAEAHTLSLPGQAGAKPLIEDGLQILELSAQTLTIAHQIRLDILQMLMQGCIHTNSQKPNSLQALVSKSLWKCPRPQD